MKPVGLEKARKAYTMEQAGYTVAQIIEACDYKSPQAWYSAKSAYRVKLQGEKAASAPADAMAKMAAAAKAAERKAWMREAIQARQDAGIKEAMPQARRPVPEAPAAAREQKPRLAITTQQHAAGAVMTYRIADNQLTIKRQDNRKTYLCMSLAEAAVMLEELGELLAK